MLLKDSPSLNSLRRTAEESQRNNNQFTSCTMGVLIDATAPLYRERDKDYITELKIIDESLNEQAVYGVMIKYCSVYIFSQEEQLTQFCNKIGQIIYLERFVFNTWHNIKLQTKYLSRTESLYCFEADQEGLRKVGVVKAFPQNEPKLDSVITRGLKLHSWFLDFFFNSYQPTLGISLMNNFTLMAEPFSMILKLLPASKSKLLPLGSESKFQEEDIYKFEDGNKNIFFIKKNQIKKGLPGNQYLLFRGVKCIVHFYQIIMTSTGNILGLPPSLAEAYEYAMNYCAVSRFNQRFLLKNHKPCQLSKITYIPPSTTPVSALIHQSDVYQNKQSTRDQMRVQDYYMIEAVAINFQGNLHMFHTEHQIIIHPDFILNLSDDQRKQLIEESKISYLYEGFIGVIDRSSECTGRLFNVHLFSNERRTQFFDPALVTNLIKEAGSDFTKQLERSVKEKIEAKLRNLVLRSSFSNTISMLLEPIKTDTLIFRLTNTVFQ